MRVFALKNLIELQRSSQQDTLLTSVSTASAVESCRKVQHMVA